MKHAKLFTRPSGSDLLLVILEPDLLAVPGAGRTFPLPRTGENPLKYARRNKPAGISARVISEHPTRHSRNTERTERAVLVRENAANFRSTYVHTYPNNNGGIRVTSATQVEQAQDAMACSQRMFLN